MPDGEDYLAKVYELTEAWDEEARKDTRDSRGYTGVMDAVAFNARLRYSDYHGFEKPNVFFRTLLEWLDNVSDSRSKKALFRLASSLTFVDHLQMEALMMDALRRIIIPWVCEPAITPQQMLAPEYDQTVVSLLRAYPFFGITQSARVLDFVRVNYLPGLPEGRILGEQPGRAVESVPSSDPKVSGLVIVEDFVGTGKNAASALQAVAEKADPRWRLLFCPLIILDVGLRNLRKAQELARVTVRPVLVVPDTACIHPTAILGEPEEFSYSRAVIDATASRVLEPYGDNDDPPEDPYGYGGCGGLVVTCHNAPNNTLPLIHHKAREWVPLFRRIHHKG